MTYWLTGGAMAMVVNYFRTHRDALEHEMLESGIDPVLHPTEYFRKELLEPEHADVKAMADREGGLVTGQAVVEWEREIETERRTGVWGIGTTTNYGPSSVPP